MRSLPTGLFVLCGLSLQAQFGNVLRHLSSSPTTGSNTLVGLSAQCIDLDGDLDALASFQSGIYWFENDGQGHFSDGNAIDFQGAPVFKEAQFRDTDGDGLYLLNNPALSFCAVQTICAYLPTYPDTVSIAGNQALCASESAVVDACLFNGTTAAPNNTVCRIFPNPVSGAEPLHIVWQSDRSGTVRLELLSSDGRLLRTVFREKTADALEEVIPLPEGVSGSFIVRVTDGK